MGLKGLSILQKKTEMETVSLSQPWPCIQCVKCVPYSKRIVNSREWFEKSTWMAEKITKMHVSYYFYQIIWSAVAVT